MNYFQNFSKAQQKSAIQPEGASRPILPRPLDPRPKPPPSAPQAVDPYQNDPLRLDQPSPKVQQPPMANPGSSRSAYPSYPTQPLPSPSTDLSASASFPKPATTSTAPLDSLSYTPKTTTLSPDPTPYDHQQTMPLTPSPPAASRPLLPAHDPSTNTFGDSNTPPYHPPTFSWPQQSSNARHTSSYTQNILSYAQALGQSGPSPYPTPAVPVLPTVSGHTQHANPQHHNAHSSPANHNSPYAHTHNSNSNRHTAQHTMDGSYGFLGSIVPRSVANVTQMRNAAIVAAYGGVSAAYGAAAHRGFDADGARRLGDEAVGIGNSLQNPNMKLPQVSVMLGQLSGAAEEQQEEGKPWGWNKPKVNQPEAAKEDQDDCVSVSAQTSSGKKKKKKSNNQKQPTAQSGDAAIHDAMISIMRSGDIKGIQRWNPAWTTRVINMPVSSADGAQTILFAAAYFPKDDVGLEMAYKLVANGAIIDFMDASGQTPLFAAVKGNKLRMIDYLVSQHAALEHKDSDGLTPLLYAIKVSQLDIIQDLILRGADKHASDNRGAGALHIACEAKRLDALEFLVETHNLDLTVKDTQGKTLAQYCDKSSTKLVDYLSSRGLNENKGKLLGAKKSSKPSNEQLHKKSYHIIPPNSGPNNPATYGMLEKLSNPYPFLKHVADNPSILLSTDINKTYSRGTPPSWVLNKLEIVTKHWPLTELESRGLMRKAGIILRFGKYATSREFDHWLQSEFSQMMISPEGANDESHCFVELVLKIK